MVQNNNRQPPQRQFIDAEAEPGGPSSATPFGGTGSSISDERDDDVLGEIAVDPEFRDVQTPEEAEAALREGERRGSRDRDRDRPSTPTPTPTQPAPTQPQRPQVERRGDTVIIRTPDRREIRISEETGAAFEVTDRGVRQIVGPSGARAQQSRSRFLESAPGFDPSQIERLTGFTLEQLGLEAAGATLSPGQAGERIELNGESGRVTVGTRGRLFFIPDAFDAPVIEISAVPIGGDVGGILVLPDGIQRPLTVDEFESLTGDEQSALLAGRYREFQRLIQARIREAEQAAIPDTQGEAIVTDIQQAEANLEAMAQAFNDAVRAEVTSLPIEPGRDLRSDVDAIVRANLAARNLELPEPQISQFVSALAEYKAFGQEIGPGEQPPEGFFGPETASVIPGEGEVFQPAALAGAVMDAQGRELQATQTGEYILRADYEALTPDQRRLIVERGVNEYNRIQAQAAALRFQSTNQEAIVEMEMEKDRRLVSQLSNQRPLSVSPYGEVNLLGLLVTDPDVRDRRVLEDLSDVINDRLRREQPILPESEIRDRIAGTALTPGEKDAIVRGYTEIFSQPINPAPTPELLSVLNRREFSREISELETRLGQKLLAEPRGYTQEQLDAYLGVVRAQPQPEGLVRESAGEYRWNWPAGQILADFTEETLSFGAGETETFNRSTLGKKYDTLRAGYGTVYDEMQAVADRRDVEIGVTKEEFLDSTLVPREQFIRDAIREQDAGQLAALAFRDYVLGAVPVVGTAIRWQDSNNWQRGLDVALDLAFVAPMLGRAGSLARAGRRGEIVQDIGVAALKGPIALVTRPRAALREGIDPLVYIGQQDRIPVSAVEMSRATVRMPVKEFASRTDAMAQRQIATWNQILRTDNQAARFADGRQFILEGKAINAQPVAIHAAPDVRMAINGFTVERRREGGMFFAPTYHSRFQFESAYGDVGGPGAMPGFIIIRDPNILARLSSVPKTYKDVVEVEALLPAGVKVPPASQLIRMRTTDGRYVTGAVIGQPFTPAEMTRFRLVGAADNVRDLWRKPYTTNELNEADEAHDAFVAATGTLDERYRALQQAEEAGNARRIEQAQREVAEAQRAADRAGAVYGERVAAGGAFDMYVAYTGDQDIARAFSQLSETPARVRTENISPRQTAPARAPAPELQAVRAVAPAPVPAERAFAPSATTQPVRAPGAEAPTARASISAPDVARPRLAAPEFRQPAPAIEPPRVPAVPGPDAPRATVAIPPGQPPRVPSGTPRVPPPVIEPPRVPAVPTATITPVPPRVPPPVPPVTPLIVPPRPPDAPPRRPQFGDTQQGADRDAAALTPIAWHQGRRVWVLVQPFYGARDFSFPRSRPFGSRFFDSAQTAFDFVQSTGVSLDQPALDRWGQFLEAGGGRGGEFPQSDIMQDITQTEEPAESILDADLQRAIAEENAALTQASGSMESMIEAEQQSIREEGALIKSQLEREHPNAEKRASKIVTFGRARPQSVIASSREIG